MVATIVILGVVIAGQEPENSLEDAALGPPVEALIDDLPVAKARWQIAPRDAGAKSEENGFDEQPIVRRRAANIALAARQNLLDPIPLIVTSAYRRIGQPLLRPTTHELDIR